MTAGTRPFIVGIGGTTRPGSSGEKALRVALAHAEKAGARTRLFGGPELAALPLYAPEKQERNEAEVALVEAVRQADGVLVATPGYHGGVSGLVKNALDLLEDLRGDERPYLDGRAVGCVVVAAGWQGTGVTLSALRDIVHALRGWPTPLGVTINTVAVQAFAPDGSCTDPATDAGLATLAGQVLQFARATAALRGLPSGVPA
ncbi:NADPH-dependent oxidoreductase (plasmid) [Deinococcus aetherius]|uniref:NADPH-dependent oxidoreductase n=1 Tax=Deinococcus aetherius TaxID=200252 RepID=A0ABN6RPN5_9DEIO|nr:NAD(P)H-dependent oxidoreductase [Deinococcus aetherius]BDP43597.1 NADPH-dependent oxidoreductase [Deinococcus aetherius]